MAGGSGLTPGKKQELLVRDLGNLPQFFCRQGDVVLVSELPSAEFQRTIEQAGFPIPDFVEIEERSIRSNDPLRRREIGELRPWAWGPDSVELLRPLFQNLSGEVHTPEQSFNERMARLYSKAWSADLLRAALRQGQAEPWLCSEAEVGREAESLDDVFEIVQDIRGRGHHHVVVKQAHGLAGHNAIRLWEPEILESQKRWMARALKDGRQLVVEPWLERLEDFSLQLEMGVDSPEVCGFTGLVNDLRGQFQANWAAPDFGSRIPGPVVAHFRNVLDFSSRLQKWYRNILTALGNGLKAAGYVGPVGIDAFVFRDASGQAKVKPIVEINPRHTMGRLTLELMNHAAPGCWGMFRLLNLVQVQARGFTNFASYAGELGRRSPLRLGSEPTPLIRQGALSLNDPGRAEAYLATFHVASRLEEVLDA
jgi:hypothetical protein